MIKYLGPIKETWADTMISLGLFVNVLFSFLFDEFIPSLKKRWHVVEINIQLIRVRVFPAIFLFVAP
jgi:hypothetical protein